MKKMLIAATVAMAAALSLSPIRSNATGSELKKYAVHVIASKASRTAVTRLTRVSLQDGERM